MLFNKLKNEFQKKLSLPSKGFFKRNRERFLDLVRSSKKFHKDGLVFLKGPIEQPIYDDDTEYLVSPENFFYYLFGIKEVDTFAILELGSGKATVFLEVPDVSKTFWKKIKSLNDYIKEYEIDDAKDIKELAQFLEDKKAQNSMVYIYKGKNPYSGIDTLNPLQNEKYVKILDKYRVESDSIYEYACESRVKKSPEEIELIQQSVDLGTLAHLSAWKYIKQEMSEQQLANHIYSFNKILGNSLVPYENIVCAGKNGSFLHYSPSSYINFKKGDLVLIDSGARLNCYCSDLTRTFPVSGKFSENQKKLYNLVLEAQKAVFDQVKPGVSWQDMHILAEDTLLQGLIKYGLVKGDFKELKEKRIIFYFMPHGLGHYLGLYVHDLPGLKSKENEWKPIDKMYLRVHRKLEKDMVLTNEPGLYFNEDLLKIAYDQPEIGKFFVKEVIDQYKAEVGGIRIEDDFVVTKTGYKILSENLPKTIQEIEDFMNN